MDECEDALNQDIDVKPENSYTHTHTLHKPRKQRDNQAKKEEGSDGPTAI